MKRLYRVAGLVLAVSVALGGGYLMGKQIQPSDAVAASPQSSPRVVATGVASTTHAVVAEPVAILAANAARGLGPIDARVVPVEEYNLSLNTNGIVAEVMVSEGEKVKAGQVLVRVDGSLARVSVTQAQANLARAQANLAKLEAGTRQQEIAQAQAAVDAAQARYNKLANTTLPGEVAAAQASVVSAQASYAKIAEGASAQELIAARNDLANAEAKLRNATSKYDQVKDRNDVAMLPESLELEQATHAYGAAEARLADLEAGATQASLSQAAAQITQAQVQLNNARSGQADSLAESAASLQSALASLELLKAGNRSEDIAAAEADVEYATAQLQQALISLAQTELKAPFAGTVAELNVGVGESVTAQTKALRLANLAAWQIETEDLTELDVIAVKPGNLVHLRFDAIPDLTMAGVVKYVRPVGQDDRGDVVYTVVIEPEKSDERMLWNMTASVEFGQNN
jgi:multidrug resistance efflux pump